MGKITFHVLRAGGYLGPFFVGKAFWQSPLAV